MSAYNDALLALGQYVYAASAWIRCDHPRRAIREQTNEHLIGLVDAVDSAAMAMEMVDAVDSAEFGGDVVAHRSK